MTTAEPNPVAVLGQGPMGSALAVSLARAGHHVTVWNRTPGRSAPAVSAGATEAPDVASAITAAPVVIVCLARYPSVHEVLDPVTNALTGRTVINTTTTTPDQARELAAWAERHGIMHVDAGIMAVPAMIGGPGAFVLYSGSQAGFETHRPALDAWGESAYVGADHGSASLYDLAILAGMYTMFAGFSHGVAMVRSVGITATDFAARSAPFLAAMTGTLAATAAKIDSGDYTEPDEQTLEFNDLTDMIHASRAAGVDPIVIEAAQELNRRQVDAGHGAQDAARIVESLVLGGGGAA